MFLKLKLLFEKKPYKSLIIFSLICIILPYIVKGIIFFKQHITNLEKVIIIEGERAADSNFIDGPGYIFKNSQLFNEQSLVLSVPEEIKGGYYVSYDFDIPKNGIYNIFLAGTPPGPLKRGSMWHSPYSITIDGKITKTLTEELLREEWPGFDEFSYLEGGYHFTKIMTLYFDKGTHKLRINIDQRRKHDDRFTIYIDAIILAPRDFNPNRDIKGIPKELFL